MKRRHIAYSAVELAFIEAGRMLPRRELHQRFAEKFGRSDVSANNLKQLCLRRGWMTGRVSGECMMGVSRKFSQAELDFIAARQETPRRALHEAFVARFKREDVNFGAFKQLCKRRGLKTGRTGRIEKGSVSWNKGRKMPFNANSAATQFKAGQMPHNTKFIGHERLSKDGYVELSVAEVNPHTGAGRRYVQKHRWLWEKLNGPVPLDMVLKCLDGDRTNSDPDNWECIPRAILPRLNGIRGRDYDAAPAELKPVIMSITKIEHRVRQARRATAPSERGGVPACSPSEAPAQEGNSK